MRSIKEILELLIIRYLIVAVIATIIDFGIAYIMFELGVEGIISHIFGLVSGFLIQSYMMLGYVYNKKRTLKNLFMFLNTFILGLIVSSMVFTVSFYKIDLSLTISRSVALIITFIINYIVRGCLFNRQTRERK